MSLICLIFLYSVCYVSLYIFLFPFFFSSSFIPILRFISIFNRTFCISFCRCLCSYSLCFSVVFTLQFFIFDSVFSLGLSFYDRLIYASASAFDHIMKIFSLYCSVVHEHRVWVKKIVKMRSDKKTKTQSEKSTITMIAVDRSVLSIVQMKVKCFVFYFIFSSIQCVSFNGSGDREMFTVCSYVFFSSLLLFCGYHNSFVADSTSERPFNVWMSNARKMIFRTFFSSPVANNSFCRKKVYFEVDVKENEKFRARQKTTNEWNWFSGENAVVRWVSSINQFVKENIVARLFLCANRLTSTVIVMSRLTLNID